jgi:hypothetical protein
MSILPPSRLEALEFFEAHNSAWVLQSQNIGLSASMMTTLVSLTTAARAAYNANQIQRDAAVNSTQAWHDAYDALREKGADYIKAIKAYAATTNNPNVYTLAVLPPPKAPSPTPAPAMPLNLSATILNTGAVELNWKASVALGTTFSVWRKFNTPGEPFVQIGLASSVTSFVDQSLPVGAAGNAGTGVFYQVQAHRLGLESPASEPVLIRLGSVEGEGGGDESLKIAA